MPENDQPSDRRADNTLHMSLRRAAETVPAQATEVHGASTCFYTPPSTQNTNRVLQRGDSGVAHKW